jgi:hypothetical protein
VTLMGFLQRHAVVPLERAGEGRVRAQLRRPAKLLHLQVEVERHLAAGRRLPPEEAADEPRGRDNSACPFPSTFTMTSMRLGSIGCSSGDPSVPNPTREEALPDSCNSRPLLLRVWSMVSPPAIPDTP